MRSAELVTLDRAAVTLRPKVEHFAQLYASHGSAAKAYREAFDCAAMKPATIRQRAYELVHEPAVAARVRELLVQAAEGTTISARARMVRLQEIVEANPDELVSVVAEPCAECWVDTMALAAALCRGEVPDTDNPNDQCKACKGHGVRRVVITPTDQLSPAARKLLKSVRQKPDGSIEVHMHDQLQAADMLNKMQGVYVDRSVAVTVNATPALDKMSRDEQLAFLHTLKPAT